MNVVACTDSTARKILTTQTQVTRTQHKFAYINKKSSGTEIYRNNAEELTGVGVNFNKRQRETTTDV